MAGGLLAVVRWCACGALGAIAAAMLTLMSGAALAQQPDQTAQAAGAGSSQQPAPSASGAGASEQVVAYCIEPMDSMPPKIAELIQPQFRCEPGTHLKRDSRPARVVPSGEGAERPFVIRFGPPNKVNAWFVRGFAPEPGK